MMEPPKFVEIEESDEERHLNNKIDAWHMGLPGTENVELHTYLGWTWEQYKTWVETGKVPNA